MKGDKKQWIIIILLCIVLASIIGGVAYLSYLSKDIQFLKGEIANVKQVPGPKGDAGINGVTETIVSYLPGKDGQNATDEQVAAAVNSYMAAHPVQNGKDGEKGDQGDPGSPGKSVFIRLSGDVWECLFSGDTIWQPISECSQ